MHGFMRWLLIGVLASLISPSLGADRDPVSDASENTGAAEAHGQEGRVPAKLTLKQKALADEVAQRGWIAFSKRSEKGDWDLYLMRPDGSQLTNITNTPKASEAAPRFSYDGTKLLYRRLEPDAKIDHDRWGFQGQVVIADADGTNPEPIGRPGDFAWATWSPDDQRIACLTPKGIHSVDLASARIVGTLPRQGIYQQLGWSPDGKWLCGVTNHFGESWTVARIHVESGKINPVNSYQNCTPDWVMDSKRIIFSHRPGNQEGYGWTQLWIANGDGSDKMLVYGEDGRHIYGGATSPDSKYILFTASKQDGGESEKDGAPMFLMRTSNAPAIGGESKALREVHKEVKEPVLVPLPSGWEPHWTYAEIERGRPKVAKEGS